jgi:membrane protease YdiL (CAAX protease family)
LAQTHLVAQALENGDELSRGHALALTGASLASNVATITGLGFIDESQMTRFDFPWWMLATIGTHHVPLYLLDQRAALTYTLTDAALVGAHLATKRWPSLTSAPFSLYAYNEFYSTYEIYQTSRSRVSGDYGDVPPAHGRFELAMAQFSPQLITDPLFLATVLTTTAVQIGSAVRSDEAIWVTGETWVDGSQLHPAVAIPYVAITNWIRFTATAVGEEALYRGVVYEELSTELGPNWAKVADMILFPLIHIPTDLARGRSWASIGIQFGIRMGSTLLFDLAYDRGGLPLSTAIHSWFNFIAFTAGWLKTGGVENSP